MEQDPSEHTKNLRGWAVKVLNSYSGVPLDEATTKELIGKVAIPSSSTKVRKIRLGPGGKINIGSLLFNLGSCVLNSNITTCQLTIASSKGVQEFTMRPRFMSAVIGKFLFKDETQQWHYSHGPARRHKMELHPNKESKFELQFSGPEKSSADFSISLEIEVHDQKYIVSIEPAG